MKEFAKTAEKIYICSDSDFEGHLISYEVYDLLKEYKNKIVRTTFDSITKESVLNAIKNPTGFDKNAAATAEARTCEDKILGFRTTNLVLSKIGAPSAGRVQSALLRLLAEKEESIQKFVPKKYFDIFLDYKKGNSNLTGKLFQIKTKKIDKIMDKTVADDVMLNCKSGNYTIKKINEKEKLIEPKLPLTTAALQQLSSNVNGWAPAKTQKNAQELFEQGFITYIRTDAVRFSEEFISSAKTFIEKNYNNLYRGLNIPKEKNEAAQNAHESIRPTELEKTPEKIASILSGDNYKLYKLIYNYSLASFFKPAKISDKEIIIENGDYLFKTTGREIIEPSFLSLTNEISEEVLPKFVKGEKIKDKNLRCEEKETNPPNRYSEAGLVKLMQDTGIGRPSTFSPTIETLKKREYIKIEKKSVIVTEMGMKLNKLLKEYFPETFDPAYTSKMEEKLDQIAKGEMTELKFLNEFWSDFEPVILKASREINKDKPKAEHIKDSKCPLCGKELVYRINKSNQKFVACSGFPRCRFTAKTLEGISTPKKEEKQNNKIQCPKCGDGYMVQRKNKKGETFWGCSRFVKGCHETMSEDQMKEYLLKINSKEDSFNDKTVL